MSHLNLALLGTPEIQHGGQAVTLPTRKTMALLIYLAVTGGLHSREEITALFWPESEADLGRTSLRKTLAYLRRALDDRGQSRLHLITDRDSLYLDPGSDVQVDVWTLQAAVQGISQPPLSAPTAMASLPSAQVRRLFEPLKQALVLYRGDFLVGFSLSDAPEFDDWTSLQRETWHRQAGLVFDWLSQVQFEVGELGQAVETTVRWVAHDTLNEAAYRRLMQLHFAKGDRSAALQAYEACRSLLVRELQVEPSPETEALAKRLRTQRGARGPEGKPISLTSPQPPVNLPLVGRAFEHVQLVNGYRAARQGDLQIITLEGEPGIGKTRLAVEFVAWTAAQGADILSGRAFESGGRLPYQPVVEAIRPVLLRTLEELDKVSEKGAAASSLSPLWLAELSRLLPELVDQVPNLPAPLTANESEMRLRLFEAIARLGQLLASSGPILFFVDDLQWADTASLEVLQYAARRWAAMQLPVLMIFTLRSEELAANPALSGWLQELRRDIPLTRLTLNALTLEDTQQLVGAMHGGAFHQLDQLPPDLESFSRHLFDETAGQPFFIVQTLRALIERGLWQQNKAGGWRIELAQELPGGIRDLIGSRLARLSPTAQELCVVGAVLGDGFEFGLLCEVAGLAEKIALPALEELLNRGLWREAHQEKAIAEPLYFFTHDRIREVAYAQLSQARQRLFHREALTLLSEEARGTLPAQLAHHALRAGVPALAFRFSVEAGSTAMAVFAIGDAINHLEQARRLLEIINLEQEVGLQNLVFTLYQHLGRAYELSSRWEQAGEVYEALLHLAREEHQPVNECLALNRLATLQVHHTFDLETAYAFLQEALQVAQSSHNQIGLAETEWNLAQLLFYWSRVQIALGHAERALTLARELNQIELVARTLNTLSYLKASLGQYAEAETCARESQLLYTKLGNQAMMIDSQFLVAQAKLALGQPAEMISITQAGLAVIQEIKNPWGQANGALQIAVGLLEMGDYATALTYAQQALALAHTHRLNIVLCIIPLALGHIYQALGKLETARQTYLEAEQFNSSIPSQPLNGPITAALCANCALSGAWEEAYAWARKAFETRENSIDFHSGLTFWTEVEALLRAGEEKQASQLVACFKERAAVYPRYRIPYLRAMAALELRREVEPMIRPAIAYLQEALSLAESIGLPGEQWPILVKLAEFYSLAGDKAQARQALAQAKEIIQALATKIEDEGLRAEFLAAKPVHFF
jgi:predicted ATPase/DNA-binding SARP family transcriptional activator